MELAQVLRISPTPFFSAIESRHHETYLDRRYLAKQEPYPQTHHVQ